MIIQGIEGVPKFQCDSFFPKQTKYCICIPIINEGERIHKQLLRAKEHGIDQLCDIIVCDGGSTDGATEAIKLKALGVNTLLTKQDVGKQGAQLRMGFWWALQRGYAGIISLDGNNKDSIEDVPRLLEKLEQGYDFIQGSRYIMGGKGINTPLFRHISVRLVHAPIISKTAGYHFTDTTNAFRGYSRRYLEHPQVKPFREVFMGYELLAYLSVRASQLGLKVCEVPVTRQYPSKGKTPTKISFLKGNYELFRILLTNYKGGYND